MEKHRRFSLSRRATSLMTKTRLLKSQKMQISNKTQMLRTPTTL